jgi:hypothetical protein
MSSYAKVQRAAKHQIVSNNQPFAAGRLALVSPPLPLSFSLGFGSSLSRYVVGEIPTRKFVRWLLKHFQIGREFLQAQGRPFLQGNVVHGKQREVRAHHEVCGSLTSGNNIKFVFPDVLCLIEAHVS